MGFFKSTYEVDVIRHDFHYRKGCMACPLKAEAGTDMKPAGAKHPVIYILGEAPGAVEASKGTPFIGPSGQLLRKYIPDEWLPDIRWNNCVRTRPPKDRTPTEVELACCRKSVEEDIAATKPLAVFGIGGTALEWATNRTGILAWSGRHLPVVIGGHTCWFFPIIHPSYILHLNDEDYKRQIEFAFSKHIEQAFAVVESLPDPVVHSKDDAFKLVDFDMRCNDDAADRIVAFLKGLYDDVTVGLDYETNALRPYHEGSRILTAALSCSKGTLAWPIQHPQARWSGPNIRRVEDAFEDFLRDAPCRKVVHNLAFEQEWTALFYSPHYLRDQPWGCSMSQAYILDERQARQADGGPLSLAFLTKQYFGLDIKTLSDLDRKNLETADLDKVLRYNAVDARYHRLLHIAQHRRLKQDGLLQVYEEHIRRVTTMSLTQLKGIPINGAATPVLAGKYQKKLDAVSAKLKAVPLVEEFYSRKGHEFRPSATDDVYFMTDKLIPAGLTEHVRRKGKVPNVNEKTLSQIKHPIAKLVLEYRGHAKVLSTYITPLMGDSGLIFPDGLAHPQTSTTRTRTWRTAANDFNYQNWPKRDEGQRDVRQQIAKAGYKVVSFDYSGIQARNVAMESLDANLIKAFKDRYDIHSDWVERIVRVHPGWVKEGAKNLAKGNALFKAYRNKVKQEFVFASLFGATPESVAHKIKARAEIGFELQGQLWDMFPEVHAWHKRLKKAFLKTGYVTGLSGFRRRAPLSHNEMINAPIQADEAIIVCDAMTRLSEKAWTYQANMEIHDDLTFIWPAKHLDARIEATLTIMLNCPYEWAQVVPLGVEVAVGDDWHQQSKVGEYFTDTWKGKL